MPQPIPAFQPEDLYISQSRAQFYKTKLDEDQQTADNALSDPAAVAADVAAQINFIRKLKFQYIEQNAKDKYVKYIVNDVDDTPLISADDNKALSESNQAKKSILQAEKSKLQENCNDIRNLTPLVEEDLNRAKRNIAELESISSKILDARLALTRLRTSHPHPRLTIPSAQQKLDEQEAEMQSLSDIVEDRNKRIQAAKDRLKAANRLTETLRTERQQVDDTAKMTKADARIVPLYDWFTESIALHKAISSLTSCEVISDNELRLTYNASAMDEHSRPLRREIIISLIFVPDSRRLAKAVVEGLDDLGDIVDVHVGSNDARGLIAAVLSRAR